MGNSPLPPRVTPETPVAAGTLKRLLADHPFFRDWDDATLLTVAPHCRLLQPPAGAQCLAQGDFSPFAHFLLAGEVHLCSDQGVTRALRAGSLDSRFPFARLRPSRYRVVAGEGTCVLKIESAALQRLTPRRNRARFAASDRTTGGTWRAHPLVREILRKLEDGTLEVPPLPAIALRVRKALSRDDFEIAAVATIIGADPAIAGRLIRIANSAIFRGQAPCDRCGCLVRSACENHTGTRQRQGHAGGIAA